MDTDSANRALYSLPPAVTYTLIAIAAILLILLFWILRKGRRVPGEFVFRASRWSKGNHVFPTQVLITANSLTLYKPQWIGRVEESIHMAHVASIKIDTKLLFSNVYIESSGGQDPIVCHGHSKADAIRMKELLERFQGEYYGKKN
jgi:hypothetical protein